MKIENTIRNKQGMIKSVIADQLTKDIKKLYKKYKSSNIDFDSFHLLICDLSFTNRVMNIAKKACNESKK